MEIDQLFLAIRDLKLNLDEAKNLVYQGKVVQCDRKLQGCQVRCDNILNYVAGLRVVGASNGIVDDTNDKPSSQG